MARGAREQKQQQMQAISYKQPFVQPSASMFSSNTEAIITQASQTAHTIRSCQSQAYAANPPQLWSGHFPAHLWVGCSTEGGPEGQSVRELWRLDLGVAATEM